MRFFIILSLVLGYVHNGTASVAGGGAAAAAASGGVASSRPTAVAAGMVSEGPISSAPEDMCVRRDFPNYFAKLKPDEAKQLINLSLRSILDYLEVPYVEEGQTQIRHDGFFKKIQQIADTKAPGAKAYISGGMVRSLLGYIYKRKHNDALQEQSTDEDEPLETNTKKLTTLKTLGIASDFDVLIEFPENTPNDVKTRTIEAVKIFINSAQNHLGLTNDQSELKRALVPDADVNEYSVQMNNSVKQGGATLDWLAFSLFDGMLKLPDGRLDIIDDFIQGHLRYVAPNLSVPDLSATLRDPDKQTMRGLRVLLEIPFLTLDPESSQVMAAELRALIAKGDLSPDALEQLKKMIRNARFGGAGNRFAGGKCMPDGEVTTLVQDLAEMLNREDIPEPQRLKRKTLVPEFVGRRSARNRSVMQNAPTFMPYEEFISKYTDNGILYHGTPDIMNFLSMIRNGLVVSSATQGAAVFGYGVYTTNNDSVPQSYTGDTGVVIPLTVRESVNIVDMTITAHKTHYDAWIAEKKIKESTFGDFFKEYADAFSIDIIVNTYPLIQNAKAIRLTKTPEELIKADRALVLAKVKAGTGVTIKKVLQKLGPDSAYGKMFPPSEEDLEVLKKLTERFNHVKSSLSEILIIPSFDLYNCDIIILSRLETVPHVKQLIDNGVMDKVDGSNLKDIAANLSESKVMALIPLVKESLMDKLYAHDLQYIPADLSGVMKNFKNLKQLIDEGVMKKIPPIYLKNIPANLSEEQVKALISLFKEGVMGIISRHQVEYISADLSVATNNLNELKKLIKEGVMDKLLAHHLKDIPVDLSPAIRQIEELKRRVKERGRKLSLKELAEYSTP